MNTVGPIDDRVTGRFWIVVERTFVGALGILALGMLIKGLDRSRFGTMGNALIVAGLVLGGLSLSLLVIGYLRKAYRY